MMITEGLAEIKTILKRITKKEEFIGKNVGRLEKVKDPLGNSTETLAREIQSHGDLLERIVKIRVAIQKKNGETRVEVNGTSHTVSEWLAWRKEVAPRLEAFLSQLANQISELKRSSHRTGARVVQDGANASPEDIVLHLDEKDLARKIEDLQKTLGDLDGKLSLINATTLIEV
jgi:hypothetical protein